MIFSFHFIFFPIFFCYIYIYFVLSFYVSFCFLLLCCLCNYCRFYNYFLILYCVLGLLSFNVFTVVYLFMSYSPMTLSVSFVYSASCCCHSGCRSFIIYLRFSTEVVFQKISFSEMRWLSFFSFMLIPSNSRFTFPRLLIPLSFAFLMSLY